MTAKTKTTGRPQELEALRARAEDLRHQHRLLLDQEKAVQRRLALQEREAAARRAEAERLEARSRRMQVLAALGLAVGLAAMAAAAWFSLEVLYGVSALCLLGAASAWNQREHWHEDADCLGCSAGHQALLAEFSAAESDALHQEAELLDARIREVERHQGASAAVRSAARESGRNRRRKPNRTPAAS